MGHTDTKPTLIQRRIACEHDDNDSNDCKYTDILSEEFDPDDKEEKEPNSAHSDSDDKEEHFCQNLSTSSINVV